MAGLGIGFGIGYGLDALLGTSPWLMIVFIFFGLAAGILFKKASVLENISRLQVVRCDKSGTLTRGDAAPFTVDASYEEICPKADPTAPKDRNVTTRVMELHQVPVISPQSFPQNSFPGGCNRQFVWMAIFAFLFGTGCLLLMSGRSPCGCSSPCCGIF